MRSEYLDFFERFSKMLREAEQVSLPEERVISTQFFTQNRTC